MSGADPRRRAAGRSHDHLRSGCGGAGRPRRRRPDLCPRHRRGHRAGPGADDGPGSTGAAAEYEPGPCPRCRAGCAWPPPPAPGSAGSVCVPPLRPSRRPPPVGRRARTTSGDACSTTAWPKRMISMPSGTAKASPPLRYSTLPLCSRRGEVSVGARLAENRVSARKLTDTEIWAIPLTPPVATRRPCAGQRAVSTRRPERSRAALEGQGPQTR